MSTSTDLVDPEPGPPIVILIPVFNDWEVVRELLSRIDLTLEKHRIAAAVVLVDDGSTRLPQDCFECPPLAAIRRVTLVELRRNLGHQRAIAVALCYIHESSDCRSVLVMDGDGEDDPEDISSLVASFDANKGRKIIFAARERRSETLVFRIFYALYQLIHRVLTGRRIRFGNFSIIPPRALAQLVVSSEIWNHYAAAIVNSKLRYESVPTRRAPRIGGKSSMGFTALVVHGLSALSVYSHTIGVRLLAAVAFLALAATFGLVGIVAAELVAGTGIPQSLFYSMGFLLVVLLQALVAAMIFVFITLAGRQSASFIPARDYRHFVGRVCDVWGGP